LHTGFFYLSLQFVWECIQILITVQSEQWNFKVE
jgi:hypothetical protein